MQRDGDRQATLGILVGGGPAPGINGVISSAAIEAINCGLRVVGLRDGYRWLAEGDTSHVVELKHRRGQPDPFHRRFDPAHLAHQPGARRGEPARTVGALKTLGIRYLVCIGGDDTTYGAARIAERTRGRIGVATVPKTIDNDLPLPDNAPTFGFETARAVGTTIVESLMEDARTTGRWYLAVSMGRKSGSLALGMCKSAGATLAVIPEEFHGERFDLSLVVDTIVGAIIKRRAEGYDDGVAVVAEGIAERMDPGTLPNAPRSEPDAYGHVHIADIPLGYLLRDRVRAALKQLGIDATVVTKDIGYELRCAKPVPFDAEYTRTLGYGAVRYLLSGGSGALIAIAGGRVTPVDFAALVDPATGRIRVRLVDVNTESYEVARSYMIQARAAGLRRAGALAARRGRESFRRGVQGAIPADGAGHNVSQLPDFEPVVTS